MNLRKNTSRRIKAFVGGSCLAIGLLTIPLIAKTQFQILVLISTILLASISTRSFVQAYKERLNLRITLHGFLLGVYIFVPPSFLTGWLNDPTNYQQFFIPSFLLAIPIISIIISFFWISSQKTYPILDFFINRLILAVTILNFLNMIIISLDFLIFMEFSKTLNRENIYYLIILIGTFLFVIVFIAFLIPSLFRVSYDYHTGRKTITPIRKYFVLPSEDLNRDKLTYATDNWRNIEAIIQSILLLSIVLASFFLVNSYDQQLFNISLLIAKNLFFGLILGYFFSALPQGQTNTFNQGFIIMFLVVEVFQLFQDDFQITNSFLNIIMIFIIVGSIVFGFLWIHSHNASTICQKIPERLILSTVIALVMALIIEENLFQIDNSFFLRIGVIAFSGITIMLVSVSIFYLYENFLVKNHGN